jgi:hypothetical protein
VTRPYEPVASRVQLRAGDRVYVALPGAAGVARFDLLWFGPSARGADWTWHIVPAEPGAGGSYVREIHPRSYAEGRVFLLRPSREPAPSTSESGRG